MTDGERLEIAGFRIDSEIGRGGMGVVYLATQSFPERRVALKVLSLELADDPVFRERFIRESNAAASTEHPNIVPVYAAGEADGHLFLAMRFIEGTDLRSLLGREGALPTDRASRICAQVADALEAAHERGLVHRDVKPGNILLDSRDHAYLSDFGLIRRIRTDSDLTKTGQFMGTLDYVAPEQIRGDPVDGRADLYSLGCVLFECLTGRPPFRREHELAALSAHLEEPPPRPSAVRSDVPKRLDAVVAGAMAKRPEDRFASGAEMAEALRGQSSHRRGSRGTGRRPIGLGVGVAALAVAVVGLVVLLAGSDDRPRDPVGGASGPTPGGTAIRPGSVIQIDAATGTIGSTTEGVATDVGNFPKIDAGEGAIWVLLSGTLTRLDERTGEILDRVTVGGGFGVDTLATQERVVWIGTQHGVERVSATDGSVLRPVAILEGGSVTDIYVAAGAGSVWAVVGNGQLSRIDPRTAEVSGEVDVGSGATAITAGFDAAWVADDLQGTVTRVDAATLTTGEPIELPGGIDDVEAGAGAVWVLDSDAGVVTPIDPTTGAIGSPIRVGIEPTDIATGLDALWVANHGDGSVSKVDPVTRSEVSTFQVGAPVATLTIDERGRRLWATVASIRS